MKSAYIHIPFCSSICTYCDFAKMLYYKKYASSYLDALFDEVKLNYKGEVLETIYIGGGTPSILNKEELEKLFKIIKMLKLKKNCEFTFECNVNDITKEKIEFLKSNGVNRISIGVQTFNEKVLKAMNRAHTFEVVKNKIALIKKSGINNINLDLIYAFPETNLMTLKDDLKKFINLNVTHISTYSLMIEPHTILYVNKTKNIDEDLDCEMYNYICEFMKKNGFIHYEISNFAKKGYESKHNLTYWNNLEYYGFGLNASGYLNDTRYTNVASLEKYLKRDFVSYKEVLTKKDKMVYELILGMRKIEGIDIENFKSKYQKSLLKSPVIQKLLKSGSLIINDKFLKIPYNKIYVENEILKELLDYE